MRTIRQRKDDLIALIREKKVPPTITEKEEQSTRIDTEKFKNDFNEYRQILISNGIKNENLIAAQLRRMLNDKVSKATMYSNLKFLNLLRSRLTEEGIPLLDAEKIMINVKFNMTDINEDDDFIGDLALEFAEVCKIHYDVFVNNYNTQNSSINWDVVDDKFDILKIQLPVE